MTVKNAAPKIETVLLDLRKCVDWGQHLSTYRNVGYFGQHRILWEIWKSFTNKEDGLTKKGIEK